MNTLRGNFKMGLNYVKRGRRQDLDSPNDFVSVAIGDEDIEMMAHDEQLILEYEKRVLDNVEETYKNINLDGD